METCHSLRLICFCEALIINWVANINDAILVKSNIDNRLLVLFFILYINKSTKNIEPFHDQDRSFNSLCYVT